MNTFLKRWPTECLGYCKSNFPRTRWFALLGVIVILGLGIRAYRLGARSLFFDEAFSWRLTRFPVLEMLVRTGGDNHPPLYFLLLKGWTALFGTGVFCMRLLSVILGGVTIVAMYGFVRALVRFRVRGEEKPEKESGEGPALVTAALVALSVFQIHWSWEMRMYTLGTALAAISSWTMLQALSEKQHSLRNWIVYALSTLLLLYTHYFALFSVAAELCFVGGVLVYRNRWSLSRTVSTRSFRNLVLAVTILTLGWLPWLPSFLRQRAQVQEAFVAREATFLDVPVVIQSMFLDSFEEPREVSPGLWATIIFVPLTVFLFIRCMRGGEWYLLAAAGLPIGLSAVVSVFDVKIFALHYLLFAHLYLLAGLALVIWRTQFIMRAFLVPLVLLDFLWIDVTVCHRLDPAGQPGARGAAEYIARNGTEGDVVVVASPFFYLPVLFHSREELCVRLYDNGEQVPHYLGSSVLLPDDFIRAEALKVPRTVNLWIIRGPSDEIAPRVIVPEIWQPMESRLFSEVYRFQGIVVLTRYRVAGTSTREALPP